MAQALQDRIKEIEDEMARTQKNKATNAHLGMLKARISKLKAELMELTTSKRGGGGGRGFSVKRYGHARVGMIGLPSVGKSTLLTKVTTTKSEVGAYEFTTLVTVPGVLEYKGAKIQLLDLPGIISDAADNKGRGRQVIAVAATCDLIVMILDVSKSLEQKRMLEGELENFGIRLNKTKPNITWRKTDNGGVVLNTTKKSLTHLTTETCAAICKEYRIINAEITAHCDATTDQLIDVILDAQRSYIPCIYVLNKIDTLTIPQLDAVMALPNCIPLSSEHEWNIDELLEGIFTKLGLIRVYPLPRGTQFLDDEPVILKKNKRTVEDFLNSIHKRLKDDFVRARVWGTSAKFQPQIVGLKHVLEDEDVIQFVTSC